MPHVILEHSENLSGIDYDCFFKEIHQYLASLGNIGTCKMRSIPRKNYCIGTDNGENAFVFFRILMAPKAERDNKFMQTIADNVIPILQRYIEPVKQAHNIKCFPTVEVGFLSKHYYWVE